MKLTIHGDRIPSSQKHDIEGGNKSSWHIPQEVPIAFVYNRRNYAVMMATPDDLVDYAIGFTLTENIISDIDDIIALDVYQTKQGIDLRFKLVQQALEKYDILARRRNLVSSASCGLCGLENADILFRKLNKVAETPVEIDDSSLANAIQALRDHQTLGQLTHTVHAAAWSDMSGHIIMTREDVGRHNALDKLLGAMARTNTQMETGFVIITSRCSYEMVEKAIIRGVKLLCSISAPTVLAIDKAKHANLTLYTQDQKKMVRLA